MGYAPIVPSNVLRTDSSVVSCVAIVVYDFFGGLGIKGLSVKKRPVRPKRAMDKIGLARRNPIKTGYIKLAYPVLY
jgi:hypothetical protein